ncbi:MAG TPA: hypothetical protein IAB18_03690 [Candidatus Avisuccinivibrio pullicola]|nr:hypothetical protein [Candidatus Avisuccinivibrio pullicola]
MNLYCSPEGTLKPPSQPGTDTGIDEWKQNDGNQMATVIIDPDDGRILWIRKTGKKDAVRSFMDAVGDG